jgi:hypothetical protein
VLIDLRGVRDFKGTKARQKFFLLSITVLTVGSLATASQSLAAQQAANAPELFVPRWLLDALSYSLRTEDSAPCLVQTCPRSQASLPDLVPTLGSKDRDPEPLPQPPDSCRG